MKNGLIINGVSHILVDTGTNENICDTCSLHEYCKIHFRDCPIEDIYGIAGYTYHFEQEN